MPAVTVCFIVGLLGVVGVPPFATFWRKFYIITGALRIPQTLGPLVAAFLLVESMIVFGWLLYIAQRVFFGEASPAAEAATDPPWEHIELKEQEFFAVRAPEIAEAPTAAARKKLIAQVPETNWQLFEEYRQARHSDDGKRYFLRNSGQYLLTSTGRINNYQVFAELSTRLVHDRGNLGMVIPSGIATDYYTQDFFAELMETRQLRALYDFENREGLLQWCS